MIYSILVINSGSSSIKCSVFSAEKIKLEQNVDIKNVQDIPSLFENLSMRFEIIAVGHRIVHGGLKFFSPTKIDANVLDKLKEFIPLAPLHQPYNLEAIENIAKIYPKLLQVGCFDTAFHQTQNKLATLFAIPNELTNSGIIRYGFHGLSYEYIASVLPEHIGSKAKDKVIVAHLGNGASMCAMHLQKSVATSMGFTALDGLMMGTRCGSIDPGVLLYLLQEKKYTVEQVEKLLYNQSGLLGVSNISNDVRELEKSKDLKAQKALDLFCFRAARELGSLVTVLKGCDAIVFTAGIGENSALIRQGICNWLDWLGVELDHAANLNNKIIINSKISKIIVAVIPTNEEYIIAKHAKALI